MKLESRTFNLIPEDRRLIGLCFDGVEFPHTEAAEAYRLIDAAHHELLQSLFYRANYLMDNGVSPEDVLTEEVFSERTVDFERLNTMLSCVAGLAVAQTTA